MHLKEPNDYKPHWKSWDLNNLPMLPDKLKPKCNDSGIQKQLYSFDKASQSTAGCWSRGELIQRWVMNE
jgi:DNA topoisomerase-3